MHHRHCGNDWLIVLAILLLMDSSRDAPAPRPPEPSSGSGCGCLTVLLLALLISGIVAWRCQPSTAIPASVASAVSIQAQPTPEYVFRALPVDDVMVVRGELVALPVRRAQLVRLPSRDPSP